MTWAAFGAFLAACALVLAVGIYSLREARRERRETIRLLEQHERSAATERATLLDQLGGLLDRMSYLVGKPWVHAPATIPPDQDDVEHPDPMDRLVGTEALWEPAEV